MRGRQLRSEVQSLSRTGQEMTNQPLSGTRAGERTPLMAAEDEENVDAMVFLHYLDTDETVTERRKSYRSPANFNFSLMPTHDMVFPPLDTSLYVGELIILALLLFLNALDWPLTLPTLWPYISRRFNDSSPYALYGVLLALFDALALVGGPVSSWLVRRWNLSYSRSLAALFGLAALGNLLVFSASVISAFCGSADANTSALSPSPSSPTFTPLSLSDPKVPIVMVLLGRALSGFASGSIVGLGHEYISSISTHQNRPLLLSKFAAIRVLAMSFGPLFAALLTAVDLKLGPFQLDWVSLPFVLLSLIMAAGIFFSIRIRQPSFDHLLDGGRDSSVHMETIVEEPGQALPPVSPSWTQAGRLLLEPPVLVCLLVILATNMTISVIDTIITPFMDGAFDFTSLETSILISTGLITLLLGSTVVSSLALYVHDRYVLLGSLLILVVTVLVLNYGVLSWDSSVLEFTISVLLVNFFLRMVRTPNRGVLSKILATYTVSESRMLTNLLMSVDCLAAIAGNLVVGFSLHTPSNKDGSKPVEEPLQGALEGYAATYPLGILSVIIAIALVILLTSLKRMARVHTQFLRTVQRPLDEYGLTERILKICIPPGLTPVQLRGRFLTPKQEENLIRFGTPTPYILVKRLRRDRLSSGRSEHTSHEDFTRR